MSTGGSTAEIDHIAFAAVRLESAREGFERLGFSPTARGRCTWSSAAGSFAAASYSVMFGRSYLDVIEHDDMRWQTHIDSSRLYGCGLAPSGIVLRAGTIEEVARRFDQRQIGYFPPYDIERRVDGGTALTVRYRLLSLDRRASAGLPLAFIHDADPAAMRTPQWLSHGNSVSGLARVTVWVPDLVAATSALEAVVGAAAGGRAAARIGDDSPIVELVQDPTDAYLGAVAARLPVSDRAALLALTFRSDLDATALVLERHGVRWTELGPGRLGVDPDEGVGCGVVFEDRVDGHSASGGGTSNA